VQFFEGVWCGLLRKIGPGSTNWKSAADGRSSHLPSQEFEADKQEQGVALGSFPAIREEKQMTWGKNGRGGLIEAALTFLKPRKGERMQQTTVIDLCLFVVIGGVIGAYISQSLIPLLIPGVVLVILWTAFSSLTVQTDQGSNGPASGGRRSP